jgi:shikimate kinase
VRPVLADQAQLAERWRQRLPWYRQAHLTVETDELSPEAVVECIMERLKPWPVRSQPMTEPSSAESPGKPGAVA